MKWYRIAEGDRRVLKCPREIEALGALSLSLGGWQRDRVFVLVTAFIDESGVGGEPRILMAALVSTAARWHGFNNQWQKMLDHSGIPYSHLKEMEGREGPFVDWNTDDIARFWKAAQRPVQRYCEFGLTTSLARDDHREYRRQAPERAHKDSAYGLCARAMIEAVAMNTLLYLGPDSRINFVFETHDGFGDAARIFQECKDHAPTIAKALGTIAQGDRTEFAGLQAADLIASQGRRLERSVDFLQIPREIDQLQRARDTTGENCPIYHYPLEAGHMTLFAHQVDKIGRMQRHARKNQRFQQWAARKHGA